MIFAGIVILLFTLWDYSREEADTILLLDVFWWWTFERSEYPLIFMTIIVGQVALGVFCILYGIFA